MISHSLGLQPLKKSRLSSHRFVRGTSGRISLARSESSRLESHPAVHLSAPHLLHLTRAPCNLTSFGAFDSHCRITSGQWTLPLTTSSRFDDRHLYLVSVCSNF